MQILVIEDHAGLGRFITVALSAAGWVVVGPITDYTNALEAARRCPINLALTDVRLSGKDCFPIVEILVDRGIPCLLMSGYPRSALPERFQAVPFIAKPFTLEALVELVKCMLKRGSA